MLICNTKSSLQELRNAARGAGDPGLVHLDNHRAVEWGDESEPLQSAVEKIDGCGVVAGVAQVSPVRARRGARPKPREVAGNFGASSRCCRRNDTTESGNSSPRTAAACKTRLANSSSLSMRAASTACVETLPGV